MTGFIGGDEFDPEVAQLTEDAANDAASANDEAVYAHIGRSREAYTRVFSGSGTPDDVDFVMRDMAWFCKAYDAQWHSDPRVQDRFVARREVFQRIVEYTSLDHATLAKRYLETQN